MEDGARPRTVDDLLADARARLHRLSPAEAMDAAARGALIVDIRGDDERRRDGLIPGALRVPRNVLEWRADPASENRHPALAACRGAVVLVCAQGYQSSLAAAALQDLGLPAATDMAGGFEAWRAAGLPVERDGGRAGADPRRALPAVDALLARPDVAALVAARSRGAVLDAARATLARRRRDAEGPQDIAEEIAARLAPSLARVINATGVVLNTNLGRAPLAREAVAAAVDAAGYCGVEWDVASGGRGSRHDHVRDALRALTGAEDACVLNTGAGAVLAALASLGGGDRAAPREVLVARGQLVEIGGGFRVPDVLAASGLRLVEVGTTNRTRPGDYAAAAGPRTAALMRVHPSNFRIVGFTQEVGLPAMAALAREHGVALVDDLGSGVLEPGPPFGDEPDARTSVAAGADLVCFSGDKLLGGPQAGVVVGTAAAVGRVRAHPLARALRLDKLRLAALEATLALHRDPGLARERIPALRLIVATPEQRRDRAERLAGALGAPVVATAARVGGGALPLAELPSFAVAVGEGPGAGRLAAALRAGRPPVACRIHEGRVLLDVAAVDDEEVPELARLARMALGAPGGAA